MNSDHHHAAAAAVVAHNNDDLVIKGGRRRIAIIAGATGFIGKHLLQILLGNNNSNANGPAFDELICLVRRGSQRSSFLSSATSSAMMNSSVAVTQISCSSLSHKDPDVFEQEISSLMSQYQGGKVSCLVNLVGIKMEKKSPQVVTFRGAHVNVTKNLLRLCDLLSVPHFVHVSVLAAQRDDFATESYHHTKWEAEQLILQQYQRTKGPNNGNTINEDVFSFTIVRPSVVFGEGDDMITNLVRSIKHLPVFPLPGDGNSIHQPVHASFVAKVVEREMKKRVGKNEIVEAVGPTKLTLRKMIETVNYGTALPKLYLIPTPIKLVNIAAEAMAAVFDEPLITPAQVKMLSEGMYSTKEETAQSTDAAYQTELSPELVHSLEPSIPPFLGVSTRLLCEDKDYEWMEKFGYFYNHGASLMQSGRRKNSLWIVFIALILFLFASLIINSLVFPSSSRNGSYDDSTTNPEVWWKLLFVDLAVIPASIFALSLLTDQWRSLLMPSVKGTIIGVVFGIVTFVMSWMGVVTLTTLIPSDYLTPVFSQLAQIKNTRDQVSPGMGFTMLLMVLIPAEELLWRTVVLLPLCAYFSGAGAISGRSELEEPLSSKSRRRDLGLLGCFLSSGLWALSHRLFFSTWIVGIAAMVMGVLWCGLVLRTKSTYTAIIAHLVWDILSVYIFPLF